MSGERISRSEIDPFRMDSLGQEKFSFDSLVSLEGNGRAE